MTMGTEGNASGFATGQDKTCNSENIAAETRNATNWVNHSTVQLVVDGLQKMTAQDLAWAQLVGTGHEFTTGQDGLGGTDSDSAGNLQSSTAGILMGVGPILTLILSHFFTKDDRFTISKLISISIGFVGVLFIFEIDSFFNVTSSNSIQLLSKLLIILAALGYMISNIVAYNTLKHIDSFSITFFATFFGALVSIPFLVVSEVSYSSLINFESILPILYLGFFPTAIAFQLRYHITKTSGPVFLSYVAYLIPIFAIIWGYILLSENINYTSIIGIILILFGVYVGRKN